MSRSTGLSAAQRQALETLGQALKQQKTDFYTAVELSDEVKAGQINDAMKLLEFDPKEKPQL